MNPILATLFGSLAISSLLSAQSFVGNVGVYNSIPNSSSITSDQYDVEVSSTGLAGSWRPVQVLITKSVTSAVANGTGAYETERRYYANTWGSSHSYANIVVNGNYFVRAKKKTGSLGALTKAYPENRIVSQTLTTDAGITYYQVQMNRAAHIVIDVDGKMGQYTAAQGMDKTYTSLTLPATQALTIHANPLLDGIPTANATNVLTVPVGSSSILNDLRNNDGALPSGKDTVSFAPGIHNVGADFKIRKGIKYYIPGDAYVNGTFNNYVRNYIGNSQWEQQAIGGDGNDITIFGHGTISGTNYDHWILQKIDLYQRDPSDPNYTPVTVTELNKNTPLPFNANNPKYIKFNYDTENQRNSYKRMAVAIYKGHRAKVIGINIVDPGNHSFYINTDPSLIQTSVLTDANFRNHASWTKIFGWRVNSDGGGHSEMSNTYNCFYRVQDDGCYPKGFMFADNIMWSDSNGASLRLDSIDDILMSRMRIENIDGVFRKNMWWSKAPVIGLGDAVDLASVWSGLTKVPSQIVNGYSIKHDFSQKKVTFSNINISDPNPHKPVIKLPAQVGTKLGNLFFDNITIASATPKSIIEARKATEEIQNGETAASKGIQDGKVFDITFRNLKVAGVLVTNSNWDQYFEIKYGGTSYTLATLAAATSTGPIYNINFQGPASVALPRTAWTFTSNPTSSGHNNPKDGDSSTRWSTGANQVNGQFLQINLGAVTEFNRIELDHGNFLFDFARGYSIQSSVNGTDWATAPVIAVDTNNSQSGKHSIPFGRQNNITAQYIRITQTGSLTLSTNVSNKWWSLTEVNLYKDN